MNLLLPAGQKFRFKGLHGIRRAKELAIELGQHARRNGAEIELLCDHEVEFHPITERTLLAQFFGVNQESRKAGNQNGNGAAPHSLSFGTSLDVPPFPARA